MIKKNFDRFLDMHLENRKHSNLAIQTDHEEVFYIVGERVIDSNSEYIFCKFDNSIKEEKSFLSKLITIINKGILVILVVENTEEDYVKDLAFLSKHPQVNLEIYQLDHLKSKINKLLHLYLSSNNLIIADDKKFLEKNLIYNKTSWSFNNNLKKTNEIKSFFKI